MNIMQDTDERMVNETTWKTFTKFKNFVILVAAFIVNYNEILHFANMFCVCPSVTRARIF